MNGSTLYHKENRMNDQANAHVQLSIMGHFDLQINGRSLFGQDQHITKHKSMIAYLILHRDRMVMHEELLRKFYEDEDPRSFTSALKMQIGRIRKRFKDHLGNDTDVIIGKYGSFQWNPALTCWVDIEAFDSLCLAAESETASYEQKLSLYTQALKLYAGEIVLEKDNLLWSRTLSSQYHAKYIAAMERYAGLLTVGGRYAEAEAVYLKAIEKDPTNENLYALLIRSLTDQKKFAEAKVWYKKITEALYKSLSVRPSAELRQLYAQCMEANKPWEEDLSLILEGMRDTNGKREAFFCGFEQFKNIYQLEVRRANRDGGCLHVALLTLFGLDGKVLSPDVSNVIMDGVKQTVVQNLRQSDVVAQYSASQFIIMLPYANLEDSQMVMDRILNAYHAKFPKNAIHFSYQLRELEIM